MTFHKKVTKAVKLAVKDRLEVILSEEEQAYQHFKDYVQHRLKGTRRTQVQRAFKKRIQAYRIVIYMLTPYDKRMSDIPVLFERGL